MNDHHNVIDRLIVNHLLLSLLLLLLSLLLLLISNSVGRFCAAAAMCHRRTWGHYKPRGFTDKLAIFFSISVQ